MNAERLLQLYEKIADAPDAVARLRRFILDLAVRGKLVPQDPADEPADELLKRIAAEKASLLSAGKIKKEKQLPAVQESDFDIPTSWQWTRLGIVTSYIQRGKSPKYTSDGSFVVSQRCVQWSGLDLSVAKQITMESLAQYEGVRFLRDNDLLWNSTGTGTIGRVVRLIDPPAQLVCDSHVTVVRCLEADADYICLWLRSDHVYGLIEGRAAGSTNQVELTAQMAVNQTVPLPPLAEQHRIVAKVDELMAFCDQLEAARAEREVKRDRLTAANLARLNSPDLETFRDDARFALDALPALTARPDQIKRLRQAILNLAVRGKLVTQDPKDEPAAELLVRARAEVVKQTKIRPSDMADAGSVNDKQAVAGRIPSGWVKAKISSVLISSFYGPRFNAEDYRNEGIPTVRTTDMTSDGRIEFRDPPRVAVPADRLEDFRCKDGDLLVTRTGSIGTMALFLGDEVAIPSAYLIRLRFSSQVSPRYMHLALRSPDGQAALGLGTTKVAQPNINARALADIGLRLPPLAEQYRILSRVDELMDLCDQLEESLTTADETRRKLLDALLAEALAPVNAEGLQEAAE
ncbi:restriction endonuclease subunit S [Rhizobium leguminosarum]|uniref:restriction endonuclease subunit S n=1 Tax=Rhizobium leguminosarum TaxID=384 RepID=UPI001C90589A|nr:restriction endonuclease subunit S [Rhizobium leguminosarum]MBY2983654.1 restriction endonuclease subunit S [Rhizobium leguminosarum]